MADTIFAPLLRYYSVKLIRVDNPKLALLYWGIVLAFFGYVLGYTIIYEKGYQEYDTLIGSAMLKVKGSSLDGNMNLFDAYDIVQPALQPDSVFLTTNYVLTRNQTQTLCAGNSGSEVCNCTQYAGNVSQCCQYGQVTNNGMKTGVCSPDGVYCLLEAWCPLESDPDPPLNSTILQSVRNSTIFFRVSVRFPNFGVDRSNTDSALITGVNLFTVEQIVNEAGYTFDDVALEGAIIVANFEYNCDLNQGEDQCNPNAQFFRLDSTDPNSLSKGFNYRYIDRTRDPITGVAYRDLYKVYGIRILFQVHGQAGRFSIAALTLAIGSGLGLVGVASVICDYVMQYVLPEKMVYEKAKVTDVKAKSPTEPLLAGSRQEEEDDGTSGPDRKLVRDL